VTTLKLHGGDFGSDTMLVRCDLSQASAPVEIAVCQEWKPTKYQCADTRHTVDGLRRIAKELAADELEVSRKHFHCYADLLDD
jgi:hypothetical protein